MTLFRDNSSFMILDCLFQDGRSSLNLRMWFQCHFRVSDVTRERLIDFFSVFWHCFLLKFVVIFVWSEM